MKKGEKQRKELDAQINKVASMEQTENTRQALIHLRTARGSLDHAIVEVGGSTKYGEDLDEGKSKYDSRKSEPKKAGDAAGGLEKLMADTLKARDPEKTPMAARYLAAAASAMGQAKALLAAESVKPEAPKVEKKAKVEHPMKAKAKAKPKAKPKAAPKKKAGRPKGSKNKKK